MALGRQGQRQGSMWVRFDKIPRSRGHAFYDRLQQVLVHVGFDRFVKNRGRPVKAP